jgi:hypothetical protein
VTQKNNHYLSILVRARACAVSRRWFRRLRSTDEYNASLHGNIAAQRIPGGAASAPWPCAGRRPGRPPPARMMCIARVSVCRRGRRAAGGGRPPREPCHFQCRARPGQARAAGGSGGQPAPASAEQAGGRPRQAVAGGAGGAGGARLCPASAALPPTTAARRCTFCHGAPRDPPAVTVELCGRLPSALLPSALLPSAPLSCCQLLPAAAVGCCRLLPARCYPPALGRSRPSVAVCRAACRSLSQPAGRHGEAVAAGFDTQNSAALDRDRSPRPACRAYTRSSPSLRYTARAQGWPVAGLELAACRWPVAGL